MHDKILEASCMITAVGGLAATLILPHAYHTIPVIVIMGLGMMFWLSPLLVNGCRIPVRLMDGYSIPADDPRTRISRIFNLAVWSAVMAGMSVLWALVLAGMPPAGMHQADGPLLALSSAGSMSLCARMVVLYYDYFSQTNIATRHNPAGAGRPP